MRIAEENFHDERDAARSNGAAFPHRVKKVLVTAAAMLLSWSCGGSDAHDDVAARRADSSAAGYDVGPLASGGNRDSAKQLHRATPEDSQPRRDSAPIVATLPRDSVPPASGTSGASRNPGQAVTTPRDSTKPILIARVRVNEFLEYDPATRTAYIDIVSGRVASVDSLTTAGDTLLFNGSHSGTHSITVPLGWHVVAQFVNRDPVNTHSAIVIEEAYPLPTVPPPAAFPQAFTRGVEDGLALNARDAIAFTAHAEGRFLIVCGVPGHAEAGQRMQFIVTSEVNVPAYGR